MAEPFIGEIKLVSFLFAPQGWAFCNGQIMSIAQYSALFSLLGTNYGGDGRTTFALPDLRGRVPIHVGPFFQLAQMGGTRTETLTINQLPQHVHLLQASGGPADVAAAAIPPTNNYFTQAEAVQPGGRKVPVNRYALTGGGPVPMSPATIGVTGGSQPHLNMMPSLVLTHIIALEGVFPSRN